MFEDEIPVGKAKDLRGQKFGRLTVLYRVKSTSINARWKCRCDCGNLTEVNGNFLTGNRTKSCGCLGGKFIDITGEKFNKLTVIELDKTKPCSHSSRVYWICKCDCGNEISVDSYHLRKGNTQSCGCLQKQKASDASFKDITNQKFGKLTALFPINKGLGQGIKWHCLCECGKECDVLRVNLTNGLTSSCGCLRSKGENKIKDILNECGISYTTQKTFESCRLAETDRKAMFDFYVENYYCIEYDGNIHFIENVKGNGWNTYEAFEKRSNSDKFKNQWCKENNIPLIRIPYTKLDTLCIEDLMLETTQFRVV